MPFSQVLGVDLGSGTVKIYDKKNDVILQERNMIAIREGDSVYAVGDEAFRIYEKTPANIEVISPMANGRIGDILMLEIILHTLLKRVSPTLGSRSTIYFTVPTDITEIEKRAYYTIAHKGRLRKCKMYLVEKGIADALAVGIPITRTKGSMIMNIGAQSTDLSVLADGRVILSKMLPLGGNQIDEAIIGSVRRKNNFLISHKNAELLKYALADAGHDQPSIQKSIGIDCISGLPRDGVVSSSTVTAAVEEQFNRIIAEVVQFMKHIPPQILSCIKEEGIVLTGGSTMISGIDQYFANSLSIPIQLSKYYEQSTISGLKEIINHDSLQHWASVPKIKKR